MSNRLVVLSRCLKCNHLQELVITETGVSGVCINDKCNREEKL